MKLKQDKEWYEQRIPEEEDFDITAGNPHARFDRTALLADQALTASSYILQLLHTRQNAVERSYLEPALIFMFLNDVRKGVLGKKTSPSANGSPSRALREATCTLSWLDAHLAMLQNAGQVNITTKGNTQLIALGAKSGELDHPPTELAVIVKETIAAMDILKSDCAAREFLQRVVDERELAG